MTKGELFVARVQATLAILSLLGVIAIIMVLVFFNEKIDTTGTVLLTTMATGLLGLAGQAFAYLFQRQRANGTGATDVSPPPKPADPAAAGIDPARATDGS